MSADRISNNQNGLPEDNGNGSVETTGGDREFFEPEKFFSPEYVISKTHLPENPLDIPKIVGLSGPARGGTTAFLMLATGLDSVDRGYFQPHKNGIRHGESIYVYHGDKIIVMKDTTGPLYEEELFDSVGMLIDAGVPQEKIDWVYSVREPVREYQSLTHFTDRMEPEYFAKMQRHTIGLYHYYKERGFNVHPFVYDLLGDGKGELHVINALLERTNLPMLNNLSFRESQINAKTVWGEADDPEYYEQVILPTLSRGEFRYTNNSVPASDLSNSTKLQIEQLCMAEFEEFRNLTMQELGL
jgi:hypothetical protein